MGGVKGEKKIPFRRKQTLDVISVNKKNPN
jgi:hypothetical protein